MLPVLAFRCSLLKAVISEQTPTLGSVRVGKCIKKVNRWVVIRKHMLYLSDNGSCAVLACCRGHSGACPHVELSHSMLSTQQPSFSQKYNFRRDLSCPGIAKLLLNRGSTVSWSSPSPALRCVFGSHHLCYDRAAVQDMLEAQSLLLQNAS